MKSQQGQSFISCSSGYQAIGGGAGVSSQGILLPGGGAVPFEVAKTFFGFPPAQENGCTHLVRSQKKVRGD